ncbi:hypothetical protein M408DRAFT_91728 [Serendipita vermifera MAFF 305830]|uniref:Ubiquitin-like domain-containing protein n=1 Tax=Serendipita vermifera MAFF 305830 TaxID=933852 RepID=A0A0C2XZ99_SERVB|nr:hypothetical protein M408DRAFT_91728 [Serendipita vermifera MAFF 305830]
MNTGHDKQKGISVVSFDGGGPGVVSQLVMMEEFMERMAFDNNIEEDESYPTGCCDLMGGVGFGGLVALLLGRLRMTVGGAIEELITIGRTVFSQDTQDQSPEANTRRLRNAVEDMLRRNKHPVDLKLRESAQAQCKVVVFAAPAAVTNHCQAFRTYRHRGKGLDCTFIDAACAILASPETFAPVAIGPPSRCQKFVGIPHGYVNPIREVFKEAQRIYGDDKPVSLFLSLGSGQQSPNSIIETRLTQITYDCGIVEKDLSHQLGGAAAYLRLNVDKGLETIETTQWNDVSAIISHTRAYLEMATITNFIDEAVQRVLGEAGSLTLGELVGGGSSAKIRFDSQELGALLKREFKPMHDILEVISERITLVDATGTRIPIPLQLCVSYEMLAGIIRSYYEHHHPPGTGLVRQGHYQLVCGTEREEVEPSKWSFIATSGMMVEMSMIRHNRHKRDMSCPKCGRISNTRIIDTWATSHPAMCSFGSLI